MKNPIAENLIHKRHGSDWLQDALYILSTKKSTDSVLLMSFDDVMLTLVTLYVDSPLSS